MLSAEASVLPNLSWVLFWDECSITALFFFFLTDLKWWHQGAFGALLCFWGFSRWSQGNGWMWTRAEACIQMQGGCINRYCTPAAVLGLCSGSSYCKLKTSVGLSMYICVKHLLRRSVKNNETNSYTYWVCWCHLEVKLCMWLLWRCYLCPNDFTMCCVLGLLTPVELNWASKLSWFFT